MYKRLVVKEDRVVYQIRRNDLRTSVRDILWFEKWMLRQLTALLSHRSTINSS
jgi:hypothetical protein